MNPEALIPPLDAPLPAPTLVFVFLMNLTLVAHFIAMGYVLTTALLQIFLSAMRREGSVAEWMLRRTEAALPVVLSFTITLGVAPLLFVQVLYAPVFYTSTILIGYQWFGIVVALMTGFYMIYVLYGGRFMGWNIPRPLEALGRIVIFCSFLYLLSTYTMNAILTLHPEKWMDVKAAGGNPLAMHEPVLWPRLTHNILAAIVIGSVWLIALGIRSQRKGPDETARRGGLALAKLGAFLGLTALFVQMAVGIWLFVVESDAVHEMLFKSGRTAAILWMIAIVFVLGLLMAVVLALTLPRGWWPVAGAWVALATVLGGMFSAREAVREVHLDPLMRLGDWDIQPQLSSLALFLVMLVAALATVGVMVGWMLTAKPAGETAGPEP